MCRPAPLCRLLPVALSSSLAVCLGLLGPTSAEAPAGRKHALLVGVRDYDSAKFPKLAYTENDAEDLADVLGKAGYSVRVLTTSRGARRKADLPTADNLHAAVKALLARRKRPDTVLVALAGHGMQVRVKERDESFFCPSDAQVNDTATLLGLTKLFADLDDCGAGVKLLLVDACRNEPGTRGFRNFDTEAVPRPARGIAALFSCSSGQRAFETDDRGDRGHGVFFHFVLEGLKGKAKNRDNEVTWGALAEHVTRNVNRTVPKLIGGGAKQTPHEIKNLEGESPVLVALEAPGARAEAPSKPSAGGDGKATDELDRTILASLIVVTRAGAVLYNAGDHGGCYQLYRGALLGIEGLLGHHPALARTIAAGQASAAKDPQSFRKAFTLRTVLDKIQKALAKSSGGPVASPP
jgi:hypothetical protein